MLLKNSFKYFNVHFFATDFFVLSFESKPDTQPQQCQFAQYLCLEKTTISWKLSSFWSILEGSDSVATENHPSCTQVAPSASSTKRLEFTTDFCDKLQIPSGYKQKGKFHTNPKFYWCCPSIC